MNRWIFPKVILSLWVIVFSIPTHLGAQEAVVKINLASLAWGSISPSLEFPLGKKVSFSMGGARVFPGILDHYQAKGNSADQVMNFTYNGFNCTGELRYYPVQREKKIPIGFYLSAFGRYFIYDLEIDYSQGNPGYLGKGQASGFGFGGTMGYQFKIGRVIAIDLFAGYGRSLASVYGGFDYNTKDMTVYRSLESNLGEGGKSVEGFESFSDFYYAGYEYKGWRPVLRGGICLGFAFPAKSPISVDFD